MSKSDSAAPEKLQSFIEGLMYCGVYFSTRVHKFFRLKDNPWMQNMKAMGYYGMKEHVEAAQADGNLFTMDTLQRTTGILNLKALYDKKAAHPYKVLNRYTGNDMRVAITCAYLPPVKPQGLFERLLEVPHSRPGIQFRLAVQKSGSLHDTALDLREINPDSFVLSRISGKGELMGFLENQWGSDYLSLIGKRHDLTIPARVVYEQPKLH